jgi:hypothetical protein
MPVQMIELEEVTMVETSDEALESELQVARGSTYWVTSCYEQGDC